MQTPKNEAFVKAFRAKYNEVPGYYAEANYTTAQMIDEAMKQNGGKFPGAEKFIQTMLGLKIDAARGPVAFDDMRNPIENVYIRKVEKTTLFGDAKPAALEHRDQDLSERRPVLDLRQGKIPATAGLQPRLPAVQVLRIGFRLPDPSPLAGEGRAPVAP